MRNIPTVQRVSRGVHTDDDTVRVITLGVQTDPPAPLVSTGVQTSHSTMPELIDLEPDFDLDALFFEEMKNEPVDDDDVVVVGTLFQAPPDPFPPVVEERFQAMDLDEESVDEGEDPGRKKRRGQHENDDFTHTRASTSSAGLKRPFRSVGSHRPEASTSSTPDIVSTMAVQLYTPPPRFITIGTQTDFSTLNRNPRFDTRASGVLHASFPEIDMHSLVPPASIIIPTEVVSYENFPHTEDAMYLVQLVPRFAYAWVTPEFIHSRHPELVDAFIRSNPNYRSPASLDGDSGTASDGNSDDGSNRDVDMKAEVDSISVGFGSDDDLYDSDSTDELIANKY